MKLSIFCNIIEHCYAECHYIEGCDYLNVILNFIMLGAVILSVVAPLNDPQNNNKNTSLSISAYWHWMLGVVILIDFCAECHCAWCLGAIDKAFPNLTKRRIFV